MAKIIVKYDQMESGIEVDEDNGLNFMQNNSTYFFNNRHGKRETYTAFRGCVIVRMTATGHLSGRNERRTVVYLFGKAEDTGRYDFSCLTPSRPAKSVADGKKIINRVLNVGHYSYGFDW